MPNAEKVAIAKIKVADAVKQYDKACDGLKPLQEGPFFPPEEAETWNAVVSALKELKAAENPVEWYVVKEKQAFTGIISFVVLHGNTALGPNRTTIAGPYTEEKANAIVRAFNS